MAGTELFKAPEKRRSMFPQRPAGLNHAGSAPAAARGPLSCRLRPRCGPQPQPASEAHPSLHQPISYFWYSVAAVIYTDTRCTEL